MFDHRLVKRNALLICMAMLLLSMNQLYSFAEDWKDSVDEILNSSEEVDQSLLLPFQTVIEGNSSENDIQFERSDIGVTDVYFNADTDRTIKVIVMQNDTRYTYTIGPDADYTKLPLQLGNGTYIVALYEKVAGNKYRMLDSKQELVHVYTQNTTYLNSIQNIDWEMDDETTKLMNQLIDDEKKSIYMKQKNLTQVVDDKYSEEVILTKRQIIDLAHKYVVENIKYDFNKIATLPANYVPNNADTLQSKQGICYDYASIFASMLRSQAIPTKLMKGYSTNVNVYHAWNEVYLVDEERWIIVDTTYDAGLFGSGQSYKLEKDPKKYTANFQY